MTKQDIAAVIDHSLLKPEATEADLRKLCQEARMFRFASVCINPYWVPLAAAELSGSSIPVCTVVGFPLGGNGICAKVNEAKTAIQQGAREIDMVINIGELRGGNLEAVEKDVSAVTGAAHEGGAITKVIIEACLLDNVQKKAACLIAKAAGADFVKTSTGFGAHGATREDVMLMRETVGSQMGVKASGGIRTLGDLKTMLAAGATRIGTSSGVKMIESL